MARGQSWPTPRLRAREGDRPARTDTLPAGVREAPPPWIDGAEQEPGAAPASAPPVPATDPEADPEADAEPVALPAPSRGQDLLADYASLGLTLGAHPMALLREREEFRRCSRGGDLGRLNHGRFVRVAGLVTGRQRPSTASGVLFLTLEDETGNTNVVVWTSVLARFRGPILGGRLLLVKGVLEREGSVIHVVAGHVSDHSERLGELRARSRDFH
jgi:DNA polymerase III, alpha subunit